MKSCPKCGAENLPTAVTCRMCATRLEAPESLLGARAETPLAEQLPPTVVVSAIEPKNVSAPDRGGPGACPACHAINDAGWRFCQHCGARLKADASPPSTRDAPASAERASPTVAEAPPVRVPETGGGAVVEATDQGGGRGRSGDLPPERVAGKVADEAGSQDRVVCGTCGGVQLTVGAFCSSCGASLKPSTARPGPEPAGKADARLHLIAEGGNIGATYVLQTDETEIGRVEGDLTFPHDGFMSGRHARIVRRGDRYFLSDDSSRNGTFVKIRSEATLEPGDTFLVGKQVFKFDRSE